MQFCGEFRSNMLLNYEKSVRENSSGLSNKISFALICVKANNYTWQIQGKWTGAIPTFHLRLWWQVLQCFSI